MLYDVLGLASDLRVGDVLLVNGELQYIVRAVYTNQYVEVVTAKSYDHPRSMNPILFDLDRPVLFKRKI